MSSTQPTALGGTQIAVGLSALVAVRPSAYQTSSTIKIISGAGTLWISPLATATLGGAAAASLMINGYPLSATEVVSVSGPATFYLAAASATMTVGILNGYTTGVSLL